MSFISDAEISIALTPYDLAEKFLGTKEVAGAVSNAQIMAFLRLDNDWPESDEVSWCSCFVSYCCFLLDLERSRSLRARSWLRVGRPVPLEDARVGFDVVVLARGRGRQPGPEVLNAPGHVGWYAGHDAGRVSVLGGNQRNAVSVARYQSKRVLSIRRLLP